MKLHKIYILVFVLGMFSCQNPDEFLDVLPTGRVIPTTLEDFDNLLNSPDFFFRRQENLALMDPDVYLNDVAFSTISNDNVKVNAYSWITDLRLVEQSDPDYVRNYQMLHVTNFVLSEIDDAEVGTFNEADRSNLKGEAHAQRAMELFLAVTEYAPAYDPNNRDIPAIPMPLEVDLQRLYSKSTVGEVYDQILDDANKALSLFNSTYPDINILGNWRPGKASVYALLAEVHLFMGNFEEAKINSNRALGLYDFLNDFNTFEFSDPSNVYAGYTNDDYASRDGNSENLWNRFHREDFPFSNAFQLYHPDLEALFDKTNDRRWYLRSTQTSRGGIDVAPLNIFFFPRTEAGLTVPRLILTNAEAKARTNDGPGAIAALNKLLAKRIANFIPLTHTDDATTLTTIKNERRKELHGSALNLFDLKRYHVYGESIPTFTRTNPETGQTFTLAPGSEDYYVKIPLAVRNLNPNLN